MTELRITHILKEQGRTQVWLAGKMGITPIALNKMLKRGRPNFDALERIAETLDCDVADLFVKKRQTIICPHCGHQITIKIEEL